MDAAMRFQRTLLSWDYWELLQGDGPNKHELRAVPTTFRDMQEYKQVFEPLLLEESCAQILRGVEEGEVLRPHRCVVKSVEPSQDFLVVHAVLALGVREQFGDNDLALLCKENPESEEEVPLNVSALGLCEGREGEQSVRIKFLLSEESQMGNKDGLARVRAVRQTLGVQSKWFLQKLSNMSTITREWVAMQSAEQCPFADILLSGQPRPAPTARQMDIPPGMTATMEAQCNPSQMGALRAGLDGTPLVLIQGPPGTGKTRTILNLLSVVMHSAQKGSLNLIRKALSPEEAEAAQQQRLANQSLSKEARQALWLKQAPWAASEPNVRDEITPDMGEAAGPAGPHCWGLLRPTRVERLVQDMAAKAHLLVCAPSNSALDEIVLRILKTGLMDKDGNMFAPSLVRVGVNVHHSVRSVALDNIVSGRMGGEAGMRGGAGRATGGGSRMERDRMRMAILDEANIVCSTLSFAGSPAFARLSRKFDVVVIDEAAQAVEPATLVPIINGCKQLFLVGDPVQLPATVISTRAQEHCYDTSLFKRLQNGGYPVKMLNTQYRMHPSISVFPSRHFYGSNLLDGQGVTASSVRPWHAHPCFGPFAFYDVAGKEKIPENGASVQNEAEANMVLCVYRELIRKYPELRNSSSVAVISPYKAQVRLLQESFKTALGEGPARQVDINTIDGFQGREKEVCLFSCVRTLKKGRKGRIGFVADERRINVGLTRARCSLIVIGNARGLQTNEHWASLIHHALDKRCFFRPRAPVADWMSSAASSGVEPVKATPRELAALDKARTHYDEAVQYDEEVEAQQQEDGAAGQQQQQGPNAGPQAAAAAADRQPQQQQTQAPGGATQPGSAVQVKQEAQEEEEEEKKEGPPQQPQQLAAAPSRQRGRGKEGGSAAAPVEEQAPAKRQRKRK